MDKIGIVDRLPNGGLRISKRIYKLLELTNKYSKVARYKINTQNKLCVYP